MAQTWLAAYRAYTGTVIEVEIWKHTQRGMWTYRVAGSEKASGTLSPHWFRLALNGDYYETEEEATLAANADVRRMVAETGGKVW